ncbi:hypothetical protein OQA88_6247 [Cercophora sp. LCS_1]
MSSTRLAAISRGSASGHPLGLGLFAYGSLTIDSVMLALLDRVPPYEATTAPGWRAAGLPDLPYPGLVQDTTAAAPGRLYKDLTEREWALLDDFENPIYHVAEIELANGHKGLAYVWPEVSLTTTWVVESMHSRMEAYLEMCTMCRKQWEAGLEGL